MNRVSIGADMRPVLTVPLYVLWLIWSLGVCWWKGSRGRVLSPSPSTSTSPSTPMGSIATTRNTRPDGPPSRITLPSFPIFPTVESFNMPTTLVVWVGRSPEVIFRFSSHSLSSVLDMSSLAIVLFLFSIKQSSVNPSMSLSVKIYTDFIKKKIWKWWRWACSDVIKWRAKED